MSDPVGMDDHAATLRAWRERGEDRVDPVRFGFIEGLVRRAAAQSGATRELLDEKIAGWIARYGEELACRPAASPAPAPRPAPSPTPAPARPAAPRGPLGALADLINHQRGPASADTAAAPAASSLASTPFPAELKALGDIRATWARLEAEQRLEQALAEVPANAGPLNSYQLVLRTLMLMRDVSPEYVQRFMIHVDALMWLERAAP